VRAKIMALILVGALTAIALLVVRQQRLQAVYEMTRALDRAARDDRDLWGVRVLIARGTSPERVRDLALALGPLRPIPVAIDRATALAHIDRGRDLQRAGSERR